MNCALNGVMGFEPWTSEHESPPLTTRPGLVITTYITVLHSLSLVHSVSKLHLPFCCASHFDLRRNICFIFFVIHLAYRRNGEGNLGNYLHIEYTAVFTNNMYIILSYLCLFNFLPFLTLAVFCYTINFLWNDGVRRRRESFLWSVLFA